MEKILISSCLLGENVRYDGKHNKVFSEILEKWQREDRLMPFCPEVAGGLETPRPPAEIINGNGRDVLNEKYCILNIKNNDVTSNFLLGAFQAFDLIKQKNIKIAILKSRSPSCGIGQIYDGSFTGKLKKGNGVTAALLKGEGVFLFTEYEIEAANRKLKELEAEK